MPLEVLKSKCQHLITLLLWVGVDDPNKAADLVEVELTSFTYVTWFASIRLPRWSSIGCHCHDDSDGRLWVPELLFHIFFVFGNKTTINILPIAHNSFVIVESSHSIPSKLAVTQAISSSSSCSWACRDLLGLCLLLRDLCILQFSDNVPTDTVLNGV